MMGLDSSIVQEAVEKQNPPVKVAMLDSGVDLNEGMMLAGRINLIPGEDEMTEIYEDATGHGTAVASVMMYDAAAAHDWAEEPEEPEEEEGAYQYEEIENEEENDLESLRAALGSWEKMIRILIWKIFSARIWRKKTDMNQQIIQIP